MSYRLEDGVPRFLPSATVHSSARDSRSRHSVAVERLYDLIQSLLGYERAAKMLREALGDTSGRVLLDVGGGTGNLAAYLPPETTYVWLDNDEAKLARLLEKRPGTPAVIADATRLPFGDKTFDDTVCVAVTHHLSDDALTTLVGELGRVTRGRVIVWDALRERRSLRGRMLWKIDRGSFPRSESELGAFLEHQLVRLSATRVAIHHHYLLWIGEPRVVGLH